MNPLTFLLYILAESVSSIRPTLVEALLDWPMLNSNLDISHLDIKAFCSAVKLNVDQTLKFKNNFQSQTPANFYQLLSDNDTKCINIFEGHYPKKLLQLPDPPLVIYYRGSNPQLLNSTAVAMVGSRKASVYGKLVVKKIVSELAHSQLSLISGLAFGIDSTVHTAALKYKLPTIAVLGGGIDDDTIYPKENYMLALDILSAGGLLVSEYPPKSSAMKHQFIARNRIIAGLSDATVIVEAAKKSGALFTADFAMDYNRAVFAIPGPITSQLSTGPHELIKQGAQMLTHPQDILNELGIEPKPLLLKNLSESEALVLKYIQQAPRELEQILTACNLPITELGAIITKLELRQLITMSSAQTYTAT